MRRSSKGNEGGGLRRTGKRASHVNHDRWLVSYADFMTLLFAFFVVLFSNSATKPEKVEQFVGAVREAFSSYGIYMGVAQAPVVGPPDRSGSKRVTIEVEASQSGLGGMFQGGQTGLENLGEEDFPVMAESESEGEPDEGEDGLTTAGASGSGTGETLAEVYEDLQGLLAKELTDLQIEMKEEKRGIVISLKEAGFFDSGSADIKPGSIGILDRIAAKLGSLHEPYMLRFEGHTDNQPLRSGSRYRDNWELSSGRANAVIRYFMEKHGYSPLRMMASGYGEWYPVATNGTVEGRARNRRVDLVILNAKHEEFEPGEGTAGA